MARKPQNYWEKRQTKLMKRIEKNTEPTINDLISVYREATNNINKEIVRIYNNYGKDSGLTQETLMHLLNTRETQTHYDNLLKVINNNIKNEDLKKKLLAKYTAPAYNYRISRFQELQEQIDLEIKMAADKELSITRMKYIETINEAYTRNMFDIQKGLGFQFQFNSIDKKAINLMLNEKWTNKENFSTRIWKNNEKLGEYLKTQLSAASLSGKSVQKISSDLAHYMQVGVSQATTLVRTEMNHFANEAEMMAYKELDIEEYMFIATLDHVTCVHCAKLDKRKFRVDERKVGVNYPPIHPNDRCTTIAVLDEEVKDGLQRRAKDEDGNTIFIPQDMDYNQWKSEYINKTSTNNKNSAKIVIKLEDLPLEFRNSKNIETTKLLLNYINSQENADERIKLLFKNMDDISKLPYKISNARNYAVTYKTKGREISDIKLTIPNVESINDIGDINTWIHENMHFIDLMINNDDIKDFQGFFSTKQMALQVAFRNSDSSIGKDISDLFKEYNKQFDEMELRIRKETIDKIKKIEEQYRTNKITYEEYSKQYSATKRKHKTEVEKNAKNMMGGGVNCLQDIYDALSRGVYSENGTLRNGHGIKYYTSINERLKEITAQYGTLSISRPDLIEMLKKDKPELTKQLDIMIYKMIQKGGIK